MASQLKQVFINILKNAIEAMPAGGTIEVSLQRSGRNAIICVTDEGIGMDAASLQRVGEPFFTTKERGTGLGMMVSGKILRDHGGTLDVSANGERGTSVRMTLPLAGWLDTKDDAGAIG